MRGLRRSHKYPQSGGAPEAHPVAGTRKYAVFGQASIARTGQELQRPAVLRSNTDAALATLNE